MHHIQKFILGVLINVKRARFSDMRPPKVDSNAYSYHLKVLQKSGLVEQTDRGYRLTPAGLVFVDRVSMDKFETRLQPKVITMLVIQNDKGQTMLWTKLRQPFIGSWTLPYGKMHLSDLSAEAAACREYQEEFGVQPPNLRHVGLALIRAKIKNEMVSYVVAQIFCITQNAADHVRHEIRWANERERKDLHLAPAVNEIIALTSRDENRLVYDEFDIDW